MGIKWPQDGGRKTIDDRMMLITAFITGLLGSFHCAGMCGPIALATPTVGVTTMERINGKLVYNAGRLLTYAVLGALLGLFGFGLKLAGLQQTVSIVAGIIVIGSVLFSAYFVRLAPSSFFSIGANRMGQLFKQKTYKALLGIGLLNGLLPCGFVYIALVGSLATQSVGEGFLFMLAFGLGTVPMMFGISMVGQFLTQPFRSRINKLVPVFAVLIGCLFIVRGLNLGIPYISPKVSANQSTVQECCKPEQYPK
jgi:sulfite exporter TauE/SafE